METPGIVSPNFTSIYWLFSKKKKNLKFPKLTEWNKSIVETIGLNPDKNSLILPTNNVWVCLNASLWLIRKQKAFVDEQFSRGFIAPSLNLICFY